MPTDNDATMANHGGDPDPQAYLLVESSNKKQRVTPMPESQKTTHQISSNIRIGFSLPKTTRPLNPVHETRKIVQALLNADPTLTITTHHGGKTTTFKTLQELPADEQAFKQAFQPFEEKQTNGPKRLILCLEIKTNGKTINDLKFNPNKPELLEYLRVNKVRIEVDKFKQQKVATVGYFFGQHPRITWRPSLQAELAELLKETTITPDRAAELDNEQQAHNANLEETGEAYHVLVPTFELSCTRLGNGTGKNSIHTEAILIQCDAAKMDLLKELFSLASQAGDFKRGHYIPTGLAKTIGDDSFREILRQQNVYLETTATVSIEGVTDEALDALIKVQTRNENGSLNTTHRTLEDIIGEEGWVEQIEPTAHAEDGKHLLVIRAASLAHTKAWIDSTLSHLHALTPRDTPGVFLPNIPAPGRTDKPKHSASTLQYCETLRAQFNPQSGDTKDSTSTSNRPPTRQTRRAPSTFSWTDTPQEKQKKAAAKPSQEHTTTTSTLTAHTTTQAIDADALERRIIAKLEAQQKSTAANAPKAPPPSEDPFAIEMRMVQAVTKTVTAQFSQQIDHALNKKFAQYNDQLTRDVKTTLTKMQESAADQQREMADQWQTAHEKFLKDLSDNITKVTATRSEPTRTNTTGPTPKDTDRMELEAEN